MIGKKLIEEKPVAVADVRLLLQKLKKDGELNYEQKLAYEYASEFGKAATTKVKEALENLMAMEINEKTAIKIIDLMPTTKQELGLIFEKMRFDLSESNVKKILSIIKDLS